MCLKAPTCVLLYVLVQGQGVLPKFLSEAHVLICTCTRFKDDEMRREEDGASGGQVDCRGPL